MDDTQKMLQAIINGQSVFRQEVLTRIDKLDEKIDKVDKKLTGRIDQAEKNLTDRLNKIGRQLAYLEDDTPTREEHDKLVGRVDKLEQKVASAL